MWTAGVRCWLCDFFFYWLTTFGLLCLFCEFILCSRQRAVQNDCFTESFFTGNVTMSFEYLSWPLGWRKVSCQHKHNSKVYCSRVSDRSRTVSVTGQRCQWENTDSWPSLTEVNSLSVVPDWQTDSTYWTGIEMAANGANCEQPRRRAAAKDKQNGRSIG